MLVYIILTGVKMLHKHSLPITVERNRSTASHERNTNKELFSVSVQV
jgi:hypothetical protein